MYYTTLMQLRQNNACKERYDYLVEKGKIKSDKTKIPLSKILEINGIDDAVWALRAVEHETIGRDARLFSCACAKRAVKYYPEKKGILLKAINTAISYAKGKATKGEMDAAWDAARVAWDAAWAAAGDTAWDAAWDAAWAAAWDAAWAALRADSRAAAWDVARAAARAAAWAAERKEQEKIFKKYFCTGRNIKIYRITEEEVEK